MPPAPSDEQSSHRSHGIPVGTSTLNANRSRLDHLRLLFPEIFEEGKISCDKIKELFNPESIQPSQERFSFSWAGKTSAINLLDSQITGALNPSRSESIEFDKSNNIFIEGDNFEALQLLYKSYAGQVKMIYIDPPYNTGKDRIYEDDYSDPLKSYLQLIGQMDSEGNVLTSNPDTGGRFHSRWLSLMYPRLFVASQLLKEDGVIFVSIDDTEVHNLRMIMNEIFGEENFVATIIWEKKYSPQNDARWLSDNHDFILLYARNKELWRPRLLPRTAEANARYTNPDSDPRGPWMSDNLAVKTYSASCDFKITTPSGRIVDPPKGSCWRVTPTEFKSMVDDHRIWFGENGDNVPRIKRFLSEVKQGMTSLTIWGRDEVGDTQEASQEIRELFGDTGVFTTPKPTRLIKKMMLLATEPKEHDIVLDFFAGSSSTAHAVMSLNEEDGGNRQFIMVQLPEVPEGDIFIGGQKVETIADVSKERIRRAIVKLRGERKKTLDGHDESDLGFRAFKLSRSNLRRWIPIDGKEKDSYSKQLELFKDPLLEGWKEEDVIFEICTREGYGLDIDIQRLGNTKGKYYHIGNRFDLPVVITLDDRLKQEDISLLGLDSDTVFICRDRALTDELATNLALQYVLKTI